MGKKRSSSLQLKKVAIYHLARSHGQRDKSQPQLVYISEITANLEKCWVRITLLCSICTLIMIIADL